MSSKEVEYAGGAKVRHVLTGTKGSVHMKRGNVVRVAPDDFIMVRIRRTRRTRGRKSRTRWEYRPWLVRNVELI